MPACPGALATVPITVWVDEAVHETSEVEPWARQ